MSIPETVLIFVGAPAAIYGAIALVVLGPGQVRGPARYRPGRPWPHEPAWFVPHPGSDAAPALGGHGAGHGTPELVAAEIAVSTTPAGGASGEW